VNVKKKRDENIFRIFTKVYRLFNTKADERDKFRDVEFSFFIFKIPRFFPKKKDECFSKFFLSKSQSSIFYRFSKSIITYASFYHFAGRPVFALGFFPGRKRKYKRQPTNNVNLLI